MSPPSKSQLSCNHRQRVGPCARQMSAWHLQSSHTNQQIMGSDDLCFLAIKMTDHVPPAAQTDWHHTEHLLQIRAQLICSILRQAVNKVEEDDDSESHAIWTMQERTKIKLLASDQMRLCHERHV